MIRSMTAYGRAGRQTPHGKWLVEIHSLNRKMLDCQIYLPREFLSFDLDVRSTLAKQLQRGQVTARITFEEEGRVEHQLTQLRPLKAAWDKVASDLGLGPVDLKFLVQQSQQSEVVAPNLDELRKALEEAVMEALLALCLMKEREGKALDSDVRMRLKAMEALLAKVETLAASATSSYSKKLVQRIKELQAPVQEIDERLLREIAQLADKVDVTEEITRLKSHFGQFDVVMGSEEKSVGRTLDFLVQEMNREINTIASKSAESELTHLTVAMKSELEKIREQVQNIE
jgi:uncharacterized protein (TIGR00255 family)